MSHFGGTGCPFQMGLSGTPTLTLSSLDLWLTICLLLCLGCDLRCTCPSCYDAQSEQHQLVPAAHPPWTSLTFYIDLEAPAVLTTRCGHAAFPKSTVPKSQTRHLKLSCSPIWLHNGLGRLRETGEGDKPKTMYIHVADTHLSRLMRGQRPGGSPSTIS